jgi:hypothetical protein
MGIGDRRRGRVSRLYVPCRRGRAKVAHQYGRDALLGKSLVDGHLVEAIPNLVDLGTIRVHLHNGIDKLVVFGCTDAARIGTRGWCRDLAVWGLRLAFSRVWNGGAENCFQ